MEFECPARIWRQHRARGGLQRKLILASQPRTGTKPDSTFRVETLSRISGDCQFPGLLLGQLQRFAGWFEAAAVASGDLQPELHLFPQPRSWWVNFFTWHAKSRRFCS